MVLTFISGVASSNETSVLTAVQLLWVNLIMDTFAALALATDPPTPSILNRRPEPKSAPLITLTMWKMIIGQSVYQLVVTLILYFGGESILSYQTQREQDQLQTLIFNTFVWMQIFNQYNNRRLDNKFNIFEGVFRNYFFIAIQFIIVAGQIMIVFVGGTAFAVHRLNSAQWAYSIILGALSIPIAIIIRLIPDELVRRLIPDFFTRATAPSVFITDEERQQYQWNPAFEEIRDELAFLKMLRGGRLNVLKYKLQHPREFLPRSRSGSRSRHSSISQSPTGDQGSELGVGLSAPPTPDSRRSMTRRSRSRSSSAFGPAALMAGAIAGTIAGWPPVERREGDSNTLEVPQIHDRADLEDQEGVEIHPDTKADDPILAEVGVSSKKPPSQAPENIPAFSQHLDAPNSPPTSRTSQGSPQRLHRASRSA